ncbi:MAG: polysaccharide biosynthesis/export family protein [Opitutales bacterium]
MPVAQLITMRSFHREVAVLLLVLGLSACAPTRASDFDFPDPDSEDVLRIGGGPAVVPPPSAGPVGVPASARPTEGKDTYRLRPRDSVRIQVINEADTLIERRINPDGTVDIPFLKQLVPIAGRTVTESQEELARMFRRYFKEPQVVLSIVSYAERRVYVSGYVGKPGPITIPPEESITLGRALSMAGGILPRGRRSDVAVKRIRDGVMKVISKDMRKIDSGEEPDFVLEDEDQIYVDDSRI